MEIKRFVLKICREKYNYCEIDLIQENGKSYRNKDEQRECIGTKQRKGIASVVEWLEKMTSDSVTSLAWARSPRDALVVWRGGKESYTGSSRKKWLGNYLPKITEILLTTVLLNNN